MCLQARYGRIEGAAIRVSEQVWTLISLSLFQRTTSKASNSVVNDLTHSDTYLLSTNTYCPMHKTGSEVGVMKRKLPPQYQLSTFNFQLSY
jgi:hypothetical protein